MNGTKRNLLFTPLLLVCLLLVTVQSSAADAVITHLRYSGHGSSWDSFLEAMAVKFKERTGISVEFMPIESGEYGTKVLTMAAGGALPDVSDAHPQLAPHLIAQGLYEDLNPYIKRDNIPTDQMPPSVVEGCRTPDGVQWSLPISVYQVITFFNSDKFAAAGLANPRELGEDWTWETLLKSAKQLTVDADGNGVPEQYGTDRIESRWEMNVHQAGGQLYDRVIYPTKSRYNTPEVREAVEFLQSLHTSKLVAPWRNYLWNGNVAFTTVFGPGIIGSYMGTVSFDWDVTLQPKGPANRTPRVNPDGFQVFAASKQKEEAWQWISFLVANVENQVELARFTGRFPSLRQAMMEYQNVVDNLPSNWTSMIEAAFDPDAYAAYVEPLSDVTKPIVNNTLNKVWAGQVAPATALEQIHELVSIVLEENSK